MDVVSRPQSLPELQPDWEHAALVVIDVQGDVLDPDGRFPVAGTTAVIPKLVALIERWRRMRRPVVHVMRIYQSDGGNVDLCRRSLVRSGTRILAPASKGAEIVPALVPEDLSYRWEELLSGDPMPIADREWVMYKPRWSAFQDTGLGDLLTGLQSTTVVIAGCNFPNCPRSTIYDATARDFRTVLVADATSGSYERGLEELAGIGVNVLDTDFCLAA